jgi:serine/threonine protein kinase
MFALTNNISFTEFIGGGVLKAYLMNRMSKITAQQVLQFLVDVVNGLEHLHKHNIVHR